MNFKVNETEQKLRGGYYTPLSIASFLTSWVWEAKPNSILEPSCGDGIFLKAFSDIWSNNGFRRGVSLTAIEMHKKEWNKARNNVKGVLNVNIASNIINADFFKWFVGHQTSSWDAVVGNPPYIRYQYFEKDQRDIAQNIFKMAGIDFTKRTNAWVPFVLASVMRLRPGGRIAMVIPSEIKYILHADGLRRFLERELSEIRLIHIKDMVFVDALQGIVLFLGIKRGKVSDSQTQIGIDEVDTVKDLLNSNFRRSTTTNVKNGFNGKWTKFLLTDKELKICRKVLKLPRVNRFQDIASVDVGIVTGANSYFVVDRVTMEKYGLERYASPMLAKSNLIKGISYKKSDHIVNEADGKAVFFLDFSKLNLSQASNKVKEYIRLGESLKLHERYKCRIREPWYRVPYIWTSTVAMLKRCHTFPRLVVNDFGALSTDTAYRVTLKGDFKRRVKDIVFSFINTFTFLFAELEGRHYGGGVLELVPSEIEILPIPLVTPTQKQFDILDGLIRSGKSSGEILDFSDVIILKKIGLNNSDINVLRTAWQRLQNRRHRK